MVTSANVIKLPSAKKGSSVRPIKSVYYQGKVAVRKNSSSNPLRCAARCVQHLRLNTYAATHVEVFDELKGTLHAVVKRDVNGNIHVLYERPLQKSEVI
jgi:hypothetical protein